MPFPSIDQIHGCGAPARRGFRPAFCRGCRFRQDDDDQSGRDWSDARDRAQDLAFALQRFVVRNIARDLCIEFGKLPLDKRQAGLDLVFQNWVKRLDMFVLAFDLVCRVGALGHHPATTGSA
jgi:hypothetical protein